MLQQLQNRNLQKLLLNGIPGSNFFHIDKTNAKRWLDAQDDKATYNGEELNHKITAKFLLDTIKYIPHSELISKFRKIISTFFKQLNSKPYIIITEKSEKSGYFFTMIFLLIVNNSNNKYHLPINIITRESITETARKLEEELKKHSNDIGILDMNDADYSGTQTADGTPRILKKLPADRTNWFLYLLRAFSNDKAISIIKRTLTKLTGKGKYIYGEKVPLILDQLKAYRINEDEKEKIQKSMIYNNIINIYFDHKVASNFSTMAHYILDNQKLHSWEVAETLTNIPLIKRCDADPSKTLSDYDPQDSINEKYRCPAAWYKYLDYDTGIVDFSKIPRVKSQLSRSSRRQTRTITRTRTRARSKTKSIKLHSMTLRRRSSTQSSTRRNSV